MIPRPPFVRFMLFGDQTHQIFSSSQISSSIFYWNSYDYSYSFPSSSLPSFTKPKIISWDGKLPYLSTSYPTMLIEIPNSRLTDGGVDPEELWAKGASDVTFTPGQPTRMNALFIPSGWGGIVR